MSPTRLCRVLLALVALAVGIVGMPGATLAHTDFDYSLPTDGASVGEPVDEITVAFTSPVTLVGNGFAVLDPQNNELAPFAVTDDDMVFRLQLDPPLAGGTVGVRYEVRAEDGHVLTGSFVFDVDAPVPTTVPATTSTTAAPTTAVATTSAPETVAPSTERSTTTGVSPTDGSSTDVTSPEVPASSTDSLPTSTSIAASDDDGGGSDFVWIAAAAAVVLAAGGFLLVRSRTSGAA